MLKLHCETSERKRLHFELEHSFSVLPKRTNPKSKKVDNPLLT